jgi:hypothetical protein
MSKKNNTLNDLEEFLKLQASALVTPPSLSEKAEKTPEAPRKQETKKEEEVAIALPVSKEEPLIDKVKSLAKDRQAFYDLIIAVAEMQNRSNEDTLLINTALYLKGGSNWKEVIRNYWKEKAS